MWHNAALMAVNKKFQAQAVNGNGLKPMPTLDQVVADLVAQFLAMPP